MMYRCSLSQGLPALESQFPSEHRHCWVAGRRIFQHHTEAVRSLWVGAVREVGLRRSGQQLTDSPGTDTHTGSGTLICNGEPGELRVCQTPPPRLCGNRARAESPAAKLRLSSHLSPRLGLRRPRAPNRDPDPFTEAIWDPPREARSDARQTALRSQPSWHGGKGFRHMPLRAPVSETEAAGRPFGAAHPGEKVGWSRWAQELARGIGYALQVYPVLETLSGLQLRTRGFPVAALTCTHVSGSSQYSGPRAATARGPGRQVRRWHDPQHA